MTDAWAAAAAGWGTRSTVTAAGLAGRDCTGRTGGNGGAGGGGKGGGGGNGGGGDGGKGGGTCSHCGCAHGHHPHPHHPHGGHGHEHCQCHCHPHEHCCRGCQTPGGCDCRDRTGKGDSAGTASGASGASGAPGRPGGGITLGWKNPNRPARHYGTSTGVIPGGQLDPCDFGTPPWNSWPGTRPELFLPYLFLRANAGDLGARPVAGPFWESPDILLLADTDPAVAPPVPPELGQTALAGKPTTLYAHVWNFGIAQAPNVVVEFYWCDPALGINATGAHFIGVALVSLGARGSGRSHAVVKCPAPWYPTFVNGGHECLLVRVWDETSDGLGDPPWDASLNRHVGQRNIHVVQAGDQALHPLARSADQPLLLPAALNLQVGPLFGESAQVAVSRAAPHEMPWLQLRTGTRGQFPAQAAPTGAVLLGAPTTIGGGPSAADAAASQHVTGDDQQITLTTGDAMPPPGQAHVYRVTASQQGQVFGGYTVVLLG
jgi:hypothetical protein